MSQKGEINQCDHKECNWGRCTITGEPICGCCGAYVNTIMTEDEKREQIFDAADLNNYKVKERGFLCYNNLLECDSKDRCISKCIKHPDEKTDNKA